MLPEAPPVPFMVKRKRRKLGDDFEKLAEECGMKKEGEVSIRVVTRSRSGRLEGAEAEKVKLKGEKV
ncbi:hypothetical protein AgCh_007258 [Apium graveolens]